MSSVRLLFSRTAKNLSLKAETCIGSDTNSCSRNGGVEICCGEAQWPQLLRNIPLQAPFLSQANFAKSRWWEGNWASKKEAKTTGLFIASKISFTAKRSLKQKYQLAGWHPQPEFSFNHMAAQCQISAGAYGFLPSAFQVLSVSAIFLPLSLRFWDTSCLFLQFFSVFWHSTFLITSTGMILISLSISLSPLGNLCLFLASVPSPLCTLRRRIHFFIFFFP